jgi:hypothetical protein
MSVWLCIPSKRPPEQVEPVLAKWREMGYRVAVQRDQCEAPPPGWKREDGGYELWNDTYVHWRPYVGYAEAVNHLAKEILEYDPECDWIVAAGDDTLPDPNKSAEEIEFECSGYFCGGYCMIDGKERLGMGPTFGVMQPTGDPWSDRQGRIIERVAGSPWLGREWCLSANGGRGPLWPEFFHMFADETLQCVAQQLGVFWQRPDLTHLHNHWGRPRAVCLTCKIKGTHRYDGSQGQGYYNCDQCGRQFSGPRLGDVENMPAFLTQANSREEWLKSKKEFERLKADGFRECMPL